MARQPDRERLQPSLLDRLTDDNPGGPPESRESRMISEDRMREIVRRDLTWLLNTVNHASQPDDQYDLSDYPNAEHSVINYGVTDVTGKTSGAKRTAEMRKAIEVAVKRFEPRIIPSSLVVDVRKSHGSDGVIVDYQVDGTLWLHPTPKKVLLYTCMDFTTGEVSVEDAKD
ncbi:MAG: type VI secretion system baseplate subunit TssE [Pseudomonadota bacterium]